jgi:hypothetical protein
METDPRLFQYSWEIARNICKNEESEPNALATLEITRLFPAASLWEKVGFIDFL